MGHYTIHIQYIYIWICHIINPFPSHTQICFYFHTLSIIWNIFFYTHILFHKIKSPFTRSFSLNFFFFYFAHGLKWVMGAEKKIFFFDLTPFDDYRYARDLISFKYFFFSFIFMYTVCVAREHIFFLFIISLTRLSFAIANITHII